MNTEKKQLKKKKISRDVARNTYVHKKKQNNAADIQF